MSDRARAIVPIDASPLASPSVVGAVDGRVLSAIVCIENRMRRSLFVARVLNSSTSPVFCSVYGESARGISALAPYEFRVEAGGTEDAQIAVPRRAFYPFTRVMLSMRGATLDYRIDARVPSWSPPPRVRWAAAAVFAAAIYLALRVGTVSIGTVPTRVQTGHVLRIAYSSIGIGSTRYALVRNGKTVASGSLSGGNSSFDVASGDRPGTLAATVTLSQFGITRTTQSAAVAVETPPPPPRIEQFAVDADQVRPGERIGVHYLVSAARATLSLLDARGAMLESVPLRSQGMAILTAPAVDAPMRATLRLDAHRGDASTSSETQIAVVPLPTTNPPPAIAQGALAPTLSAGQFVQPAAAVAGRALPVRILDSRAALSLVLQDRSGRAVSSAEVAPGQPYATLEIPSMQRDTTLLLVVTLRSGQGEQSLLMPIPVRAHP